STRHSSVRGGEGCGRAWLSALCPARPRCPGTTPSPSVSFALQVPAGHLQLLASLSINLGQGQIQPFERINDRRCYHQAREPFVVRRNHIPWSVRRGRALNRLLVGAQVLVPVLALFHVAHRELPVLFRLLQTPKEAFLLFLLRHVQKELADHNAVARQVAL